jgi:hypothetical protein
MTACSFASEIQDGHGVIRTLTASGLHSAHHPRPERGLRWSISAFSSSPRPWRLSRPEETRVASHLSTLNKVVSSLSTPIRGEVQHGRLAEIDLRAVYRSAGLKGQVILMLTVLSAWRWGRYIGGSAARRMLHLMVIIYGSLQDCVVFAL